MIINDDKDVDNKIGTTTLTFGLGLWMGILTVVCGVLILIIYKRFEKTPKKKSLPDFGGDEESGVNIEKWRNDKSSVVNLGCDYSKQQHINQDSVPPEYNDSLDVTTHKKP